MEHDLLDFLVVDQIGTALFFVQVSIYTNASRWQQKWVNDFPVPCALKFDMTCTMDVLSSLTRALLDPEEIEEWYVVVYLSCLPGRVVLQLCFETCLFSERYLKLL